MGAYLQRVRTLPGHGRFRTGLSLRAPFKGPSEQSSPGSSEDRFILFVSFPYLGRASENIQLGPERESTKLPDFKLLGVAEGNEEERVDIGEVLVHQARYMIFDNCRFCFFPYF